MDVIRKKLVGLVVIALFLLATAGAASAATLDLPKWVIVPEDSQFSDVTLFCGLDAYDASTNTTPCYVNGNVTNAQIYFADGYPKLVMGKIGNAFELSNTSRVATGTNVADTNLEQLSVTLWIYLEKTPDHYAHTPVIRNGAWDYNGFFVDVYNNRRVRLIVPDGDEVGSAHYRGVVSNSAISQGAWHFVVMTFDAGTITIYIDGNKDAEGSVDGSPHIVQTTSELSLYVARDFVLRLDEVRVYKNKVLTPDEIKLLYLAGRKKLSEPAQFRQIFSPLIDLTRDRATFYAGLEVSTTDPNGYVPVPESAVNMSITSAPKLTSDYTGAPFYYQGHYWYRADKIQFNLPIQFETVRESGGFSKEILLDDDKKTFVYEKEFKVTNPTAAKLNVVYTVDPTELGFSPLQYPQFELDGVTMAEWSPSNSSTLYLIRTDSLEPGEISTHWIKSVWTLTKEEVEFPASFDDFRSITDWTAAQRMAENAVEGKTDTYVRVIKIDSNADVSNVTVLVPLKDVEDENDVIEAVALTGSRETLQVEKLEDGKVVVKVPGTAFVSGHAEIKVLYNKESSFWQRILNLIHSMMAKIKSFFGLGGG